jgi:hypothetical protein
LRVERWVSSKGVSNWRFAVKIYVMIVVLFIEFSIKMIIYSTFDSSFWSQMGYWVICVHWCVSSSMFFYKNVNLSWIYDKNVLLVPTQLNNDQARARNSCLTGSGLKREMDRQTDRQKDR